MARGEFCYHSLQEDLYLYTTVRMRSQPRVVRQILEIGDFPRVSEALQERKRVGNVFW